MLRRYARRALRNKCSGCGEPRESGRSHCSYCQVLLSRRVKRLREARKAAGLCIQCGSPRGDRGTATYCADCAAKKAQAQKRVVTKRVAWGKCRCGATLTGTYRNCLNCRIVAGQGVARRRAAKNLADNSTY